MRTDGTVSYSNLTDFDMEPFDDVPASIAIYGDGGATSGTFTVSGTCVDNTGVLKGQAAILVLDTADGWIAIESEL